MNPAVHAATQAAINVPIHPKTETGAIGVVIIYLVGFLLIAIEIWWLYGRKKDRDE